MSAPARPGGAAVRHIDIFREHYARFFDHADTYRLLLGQHGLLDGCESLLSIGAGAGQLEIRLAAELGIRIGYVDPSPEMARAFEQGVAEAGIAALIVERHVERFQSVASGERYDLALSIYSWFSMGYDRRMLDKVFSMLKPGGHLFVAVPSASEAIRDALGRRPRVSGEELSAWAHKEGLAYRFFLHTATTKVGPGELIVDGTPSPAARDFIAFRSGCQWEALSSAEQAAAMAVLGRAEAAGRLERIGGCLIFDRP